jgi:hypothetical protein
MSRFLSIYNIRVRVVSDIQTLAFGSSLYIRYNTAAHVVNSTYKLTIALRKIVTLFSRPYGKAQIRKQHRGRQMTYTSRDVQDR